MMKMKTPTAAALICLLTAQANAHHEPASHWPSEHLFDADADLVVYNEEDQTGHTCDPNDECYDFDGYYFEDCCDDNDEQSITECNPDDPCYDFDGYYTEDCCADYYSDDSNGDYQGEFAQTSANQYGDYYDDEDYYGDDWYGDDYGDYDWEDDYAPEVPEEPVVDPVVPDVVDPVVPDVVVPDNDQATNFTVTAPNADLTAVFSQQIKVFGVTLVGSSGVPEAKLVHAATMMAEYLDNDEDGNVDDPLVAQAMQRNNALLTMFRDSAEKDRLMGRDFAFQNKYWIQDLQADETNVPGRFDATIEEVLHLIQTSGYAHVYSALSPEGNSELLSAVDAARGGRYENPPRSYPSTAWYHYDDRTCNRGCNAVEYFYFGLTSLLGAQATRCGEIDNEWELCTSALVQSRDPTLHALLTNPAYKLPTVIPNGVYR